MVQVSHIAVRCAGLLIGDAAPIVRVAVEYVLIVVPILIAFTFTEWTAALQVVLLGASLAMFMIARPAVTVFSQPAKGQTTTAWHRQTLITLNSNRKRTQQQ